MAKIAVLWIEESPIVPNVHVVGEGSGGESSEQPDVQVIVVVGSLVLAQVRGDHGDKAEDRLGH